MPALSRGRGIGGALRDCWASLRPEHWIKNALVFAPLLAAHETAVAHYLLGAIAFVALSACASAGYILNDLVDLPDDRRHPTKRCRPMAAGKVESTPMLALGGLLAASGIAGAFWISTAVGICTSAYLIVSALYSMSLKRKLFLDVVVLAALYMARVVAGALVVPVPLSPWFLGFFLFVFLALAFVKRLRELRAQVSGDVAQGRRAWREEDLPVVAAFSVASGLASALVFALYISTPQVSEMYARPEFLWPICPLLIYWLGRMALLANRGGVDYDPVLFALRDRTSWLTGLAIAAAFLASL